MTGTRFTVGPLAAERWAAGAGTPVVLLHAGVADLRVWHGVAPLLGMPAVAYDRRRFGATPVAREPFTHLDDLLAVLDAVADGPAWLVGNSMGGALALDAALSAPERVAGLVLIAPAVSGEPEFEELDPATARLDALLEDSDDLDVVARLETWLWLDGPAGPEGRVEGAARALALDMNERILRNAVPEEAGESGLDAWSRLEELRVPATVVWGSLDIPVVTASCRVVAERIPGARTVVLDGVAHLPSLERPGEVAAVVRAAVAEGSRRRT